MSSENFPCPICGNTVSKTDLYCKNCGTRLAGFTATTPTTPPPPEPMREAPPPPPPYQRKFSVLQRYYKLVVAPSEAMEDIALAPDYKGYFGILLLLIALGLIAIAMALQKIQFTGTYAPQIYSIFSGILGIGVVLASILLVVRWLVKSFIVRFAGNSGSGWSFNTAASVTAYAYIVDVIVGVISVIVSWFLVPTFRVDITDLTLAAQQISSYRAQLNLIRLTFTLPFSLLGVVWKSYLGGLGTHFGTDGKCSRLTGFIIFFVLSLIGVLISFLASP